MHFFVLILCLVQVQVQGSDWLNRTVRVDLIVSGNRRAYDSRYDLLVQSGETSGGINATNGQYPWIIHTTAWSEPFSGFRIGVGCAGVIISGNNFLSEESCVGKS